MHLAQQIPRSGDGSQRSERSERSSLVAYASPCNSIVVVVQWILGHDAPRHLLAAVSRRSSLQLQAPCGVLFCADALSSCRYYRPAERQQELSGWTVLCVPHVDAATDTGAAPTSVDDDGQPAMWMRNWKQAVLGTSILHSAPRRRERTRRRRVPTRSRPAPVAVTRVRKESGELAAVGRRVTACVERELDLGRLSSIHDWLWVAGLPLPPRALHNQLSRAPILLQEGTATAPDEADPLTGRNGTPRSRQGLQSLRRNDLGELLLPKDLSAPLSDQHILSFLLSCVFVFLQFWSRSSEGRCHAPHSADALHSGCETQPERKSLPRPIRMMSDDSDATSHATLHPADGCEAPTKERLEPMRC
ncbi:hypothetical protein Purlil1_12939 [Purpureocillium lilacinum]|uniref:Uncharacterized protein n=1 Tax=Purpureocillium lilacinum TaxID=33203 RepID=A0ABR0BFG9_PURLI|nr:hypothetical protein Purlil1_12939 [Purpureocillium lilacinum]